MICAVVALYHTAYIDQLMSSQFIISARPQQRSSKLIIPKQFPKRINLLNFVRVGYAFLVWAYKADLWHCLIQDVSKLSGLHKANWWSMCLEVY